MSVFLTRVPRIFGVRRCLIAQAARSSISARIGYASQAALNEPRESNLNRIKASKKLGQQKEADTSLEAVTQQVLSLGEKLLLKRHLERKAQKSPSS